VTDQNEGGPGAGTPRPQGRRSGKAGPNKDSAAGRARRDFKGVAAAALAAADRVVQHWLPGGKREGHEWRALNPTRSDSRRGSFSVNLQTGRWADFASDQRGGDVVALVKMLDGCSMGEACDRLAEFLGLPPAAPAADRAHGSRRTAATAAPAAKPQVKSGDGAEPLAPVPDDAPPAPEAHPRHGRPDASWDYFGADGRLLMRVARFDRSDGGKEVLPLTFWRERHRIAWRWRALPAPRPLFGLDRLAARPAAPVLICEGEKAASAAGRLLPAWVAVTSSSGSRSAAKTDWAPLRGRSVVLWADADQPGRAYVEEVATLALAAGATSVALLRLEALAALRGAGELPAGWDAADAEGEGLDPAALAALMADPAALEPRQPPPAAKPDRKPAPRSEGRSGPRTAPQDDRSGAGGFFVIEAVDGSGLRAGVYWQPPMARSRDGERVEPPPAWLCSPLRVTARTRDSDGASWGRLLEWIDAEGTPRLWAAPAAMFQRGGDELREELAGAGVEIATDANARRHLLRYVAETTPPEFARCATRCGWHGDRYLTAAGTIGEGAERLIYQHGGGEAAKWAQAGTFEGWRSQVCAPLAGNSRPVAAVSAALAAACLGLIEAESGGLHWRGSSSAGKTTLLRLAASTVGHPVEFLKSWRATANSLEGVAAAASDAPLLLDEIGQLEAREAAGTAYMLANGAGKSRATRTGGLRPAARWRVLFQSTGEVPLSALVAEAGGRTRAGHEVRLIDIPAEAGAGWGIFERLPEATAPGAFADALRAAALEHHGHAAPEFIRRLVADLDSARKFLRLKVDRLAAELAGDDVAGQVRRVAQRFALIAAAGELASAFELTGWPKGEAEGAARRCFNDWLSARGGAGEAEPRAMLAQVRHFLAAHAEGRFSPWERGTDDHRPKTMLRVGWRRQDMESGSEFFIFADSFRREVAAGFDATECARVLARAGLLKPESDRCLTRRERLPDGTCARVYRISGRIFEAEL
jgi:uncharacterized protein (DUF927 family)